MNSANINAERIHDRPSSPIQRYSQQPQLPSSARKRSNPVDKENVACDGQSQRYVTKSPQKVLNGPLAYKTQPSIQSSFQQPRKRPSPNRALFSPNNQDASSQFYVDAENELSMYTEYVAPIHTSLHMQQMEERRRYNSDPVAASLERQWEQENTTTTTTEKEVLPLQAWTSNWRDTRSSSDAAAIMRPRPVRPTAVLP